jgi:TonB family protein
MGAPADEQADAAPPRPDPQAEVQAAPDPEPQAQPEPKPQAQPEPKPEPELRQVATLIPPDGPELLRPEALALPAPALEPLPVKPAEPVAAAHRAPPQPAPPQIGPRQSAARAPGPPAARDEYLANLVMLVRPHLRLLSSDMLSGRSGTTSLAIRVLGDGTIARIAVSHSSGYPDIDTRVMQIIAAVGRFPPLPPWIRQPSWDINFHLRFPFPQAGIERP